MLETAIYVRVSTEEQAQEGFSIRAQEQKLKDYTRIKDWSIYKIYRDEGISGKNITERPAVKEMIEDIQKGHVKNVLVFKIDRLTRNTKDLLYLVDLFNEHNCAFNSLNESIDTQSATGRMFIKIIGIFAEFERENISERSRLGFERKAREGYTTACAKTSYGYDRPKGTKIQTINEAEAVIVKEIFDMFVNKRMSYYHMAKHLNSRNIPTKFNSTWNERGILNILTNCNHMGYVRYATHDEKRNFETKGLHEAIISEELYNEAQSLMKKLSKKVYKKHPKEDCIFSGVLYCGYCGEKLIIHGSYYDKENGEKGRNIDYRCTGRVKGSGCPSRSVRQYYFEKAFVEYINNIEDFDTLDEIQLAMKQEIKDQNLELIASYKRQIEKLERKEKEILVKYIDENIDFDSYMELKKKIDREKKTLTGSIETVEVFVEEEITIKNEHIIKTLKENWEWLNDKEKRQFIINFVERIDVVNEKVKGSKLGNIKILNIEFNQN